MNGLRLLFVGALSLFGLANANASTLTDTSNQQLDGIVVEVKPKRPKISGPQLMKDISTLKGKINKPDADSEEILAVTEDIRQALCRSDQYPIDPSICPLRIPATGRHEPGLSQYIDPSVRPRCPFCREADKDQ